MISTKFQDEAEIEASYLDAKTYGVGRLITLRKLFLVPEHQRDFAWGLEEVRQFFDDITQAMESSYPDYFIGLIVLLGPRKGTWQILDGQQRLATATMIYSAIRNWLAERESYEEDAKQIEDEFIGVRQLGGEYKSRLTLNVANKDTFRKVVIEKCPTEELHRRLEEAPRYSSNRLLIEATLTCRQLISDFAKDGGSDTKEQAAHLFSLASYLENRVKAVVVDVVSETNAFVIFEALNARGNDLSVMDLVKNHIFGNAGPDGIAQVRPNWIQMSERIEDKNADDFLKVFWTSRFGRVQKPQLYERIKREFNLKEGALELAENLAIASDHYIALDDPQHEIWASYGEKCKKQIETLILLGNRQVRAPIMSAIAMFGKEQMEYLLHLLIVLTVRYQIVGRRRTGTLEIACARLANLIHQGAVTSELELRDNVASIVPNDEEFYADFLRFSERKASRAAYFLAQLELCARQKQGVPSEHLHPIAHSPLELSVDFVLPKNPEQNWRDLLKADPELVQERVFWLGNRCLIEESLAPQRMPNLSFVEKSNRYYRSSRFLLTRAVSNYENWGWAEIEERQRELASLAVESWPLPRLTEGE